MSTDLPVTPIVREAPSGSPSANNSWISSRRAKLLVAAGVVGVIALPVLAGVMAIGLLSYWMATRPKEFWTTRKVRILTAATIVTTVIAPHVAIAIVASSILGCCIHKKFFANSDELDDGKRSPRPSSPKLDDNKSSPRPSRKPSPVLEFSGEKPQPISQDDFLISLQKTLKTNPRTLDKSKQKHIKKLLLNFFAPQLKSISESVFLEIYKTVAEGKIDLNSPTNRFISSTAAADLESRNNSIQIEIKFNNELMFIKRAREDFSLAKREDEWAALRKIFPTDEDAAQFCEGCLTQALKNGILGTLINPMSLYLGDHSGIAVKLQNREPNTIYKVVMEIAPNVDSQTMDMKVSFNISLSFQTEQQNQYDYLAIFPLQFSAMFQKPMASNWPWQCLEIQVS